MDCFSSPGLRGRCHAERDGRGLLWILRLLSYPQLLLGFGMYSLEHAVQVVTHIGRWEADHMDALCLHPRISLAIVLCLFALMRSPVDFDHKTGSVAVEVCDVGAECRLRAEVQSIHFLALKCLPQPFLRRGEFAPEFLCTLDGSWCRPLVISK